MDESKILLLCDIMAEVTGLERDLITAEIQEGARRRVARRVTRAPPGDRSRLRQSKNPAIHPKEVTRLHSAPPMWNRASLAPRGSGGVQETFGRGSGGRVQEDGPAQWLGVASGEGRPDVEAPWGVVRGARRAGNHPPHFDQHPSS